MLGENIIELNSVAMNKALEFYLNSEFVTKIEVKDVKWVSGTWPNGKFVIEFVEKTVQEKK